MKFCKQCKSILISSTSTNELIYVCNNCGQKEKSTAKDTLMFSESLKTANLRLKYNRLIENAYEDPVNPFGDQCKTCGKKTKFVRIGSNMQRIDVCKH